MTHYIIRADDGRLVLVVPTRFFYRDGVTSPIEGIDEHGGVHPINRRNTLFTVAMTAAELAAEMLRAANAVEMPRAANETGVPRREVV